MNAKELDENIEELEKRVDRLRALYEQYFMGIERIEPQILRKDVERRLYVLRREKIRNTAVRFKFQQVLQRYTTYQTYWQRVGRQIEEGTYRRDVMKTRARLLAQRDERRRQRLAGQGRLPAGAAEEGIDVDVDVDVDEGEGLAAADAGQDHGDGLSAADIAALGLDDDAADDLPAEKTEPRIQVHELASEVRALSKVAEEVDDVGEAPQLTFGAPRRPTPEVPARPSSRPPAGPAALGRIALKRVAAKPARGADEETLPVAVEPFVPSEPGAPPVPTRPSNAPAGARALGEPLGTASRPGEPPVLARSVVLPPAAPLTPPPLAQQAASVPPPRTRQSRAASTPGDSLPPPRAFPLAEPLPAPRRPPPPPPEALVARAKESSAGQRPISVKAPGPVPASAGPPLPPPAAAVEPRSARATVRGQGSAPPPSPESGSAAAPVSPGPPRAPSGETDLRALFLKRTKPAATPTPPEPPRGAPAPPPTKRKSRHSIAKPQLPAPRPPAPSATAGSISDERMRAIYDRYAAERRRNNEGEVHFETVAKSIRDMLPKLEEKAPGRKVDFEVVIKDGKTVLKPVAK